MFIYFDFFITGRRKEENEEELCFLRPVFHTKHIYTTVYTISNNSKQHKYKLYNTTMNRPNVLFVNKHCCN